MHPFIRTTAAGCRKIAQQNPASHAVRFDSPNLYLHDVVAVGDDVDGHQLISQPTPFGSYLVDMDAISDIELDNERLCKINEAHLQTTTALQKYIKFKRFDTEYQKEKMLFLEQTIHLKIVKLWHASAETYFVRY